MQDHREISNLQELCMFSDLSPGSAFFLPNGVKIYNRLLRLLQKEYRKRGFQEVMTPTIAKKELWETSGHWYKYRENMLNMIHDGEIYSCKAMNCPLHCCIFKNKSHSYKELPIRLADFGTLHRNEASGALSGLTRVLSFHQDDAHIFCTREQISTEIKDCLKFMADVYRVFGFKFEIRLSTRPEKYIGDLEVWNQAEDQLKSVLEEAGYKFEIEEQGGAFYGPKIDIKLADAFDRKHQCATIQLDFQLPHRFGLEYVDALNQPQTPIMIHRAIYGSFERFFAILTEHYQGKWPFWLSPKQVIVIPVAASFDEASKEMGKKLYKYNVEVDLSEDMFNKKVARARTEGYNYILVVGQKEVDNNTVSIRGREGKAVSMTIEEMLRKFGEEKRVIL